MKLFANEADLVAKFCAEVERLNRVHSDGRFGEVKFPIWTIYHETADWDVLLVDHETGTQVGIQAKMSLNVKVVTQALPGSWSNIDGPDYRAVLVPREDIQGHISELCHHVGITVITASQQDYPPDSPMHFHPSLPTESCRYDMRHWHPWLPREREKLPAYVPDVQGGKASPVTLTDWKVRAIKLMILLERQGYVTRGDMAVLEISPSRWTDRFRGFLTPGAGCYVAHRLTPDLKAQHPRNWAEIEADFDTWSAGLAYSMRQKASG